MKTKTFTTMGALHPVLFFAGVYVVALLFSIFICSSLFYSCNTSSSKITTEQQKLMPEAIPANTSAAGIVAQQ